MSETQNQTPEQETKGIDVLIMRKVFVKAGKAIEPTFDDNGKPTKVVNVSKKVAETWVDAGVAKVKI